MTADTGQATVSAGDNSRRKGAGRDWVHRHGGRRLLAAALTACAAAAAIAIWQLEQGSAAAPALDTVRVIRGDVVLSVGGVGRIVAAGEPAQIDVSGGATGNNGGGTSASPNTVFATTQGHVAALRVRPGQHVVRGQVLAVLRDGGAAVANVQQAQDDLATAQLELRRLLGVSPVDVVTADADAKKAASDLAALRARPQPEAIAAARSAVAAARRRLAKLTGPPDPAAVATARAELQKAQSDLAVLLKPAQPPLPEVVAAAEQAVAVARQSVQQAQEAGDPAGVSAAQLELYRAQVELATLRQPAPAPLPEEVASAQAAVDAAQLNLKRAQAPADPSDVAAARADLAHAVADLAALEHPSAATQRAALAAAKEALAAARAKQASLRSGTRDPLTQIDIRLARLKVAAAKSHLTLARIAQRALAVRAPSAGIVTQLLTVRGAPVDVSTPVATVVNIDRLQAVIQLSEFDIARVKDGLSAIVRVDALADKAYAGKVLFTSPIGIDNGGVVTYPVTIELTHSRAQRVGGPKPGMNASVRIILAQRSRVLQLPLEAIAHDSEDRPIVTVLGKSGKTTLHRVSLGLANNKSVQVIKGLQLGDRVVLAPSEDAGD